MKRINVSSGAPWEEIVGYSRAVKTGSVIEVAGTTAIDNQGKVVGNDVYQQTLFILEKIQKTLQSLGSDLQDITRTRIYTTDIKQWELIGKAHGMFFRKIKPVSTMIEVSSLVEPELLVEIEVTAMITA